MIAVCVLLTLGTVSCAVAGNDAFGIEMHSDASIILFGDKYIGDSSFMIHPWFIPGAQSNIIVRYIAPVPGFRKFEFGGGPTWATDDDVEKIRFISGELDFQLYLGNNVLWQSYNLAQIATDDDSADSGLLRQQLKFGDSHLGIFNENRLNENKPPENFLGLYYNLAPLKFLSTCKLVVTINLNNGDEYFVAWIAEF